MRRTRLVVFILLIRVSLELIRNLNFKLTPLMHDYDVGLLKQWANYDQIISNYTEYLLTWQTLSRELYALWRALNSLANMGEVGVVARLLCLLRLLRWPCWDEVGDEDLEVLRYFTWVCRSEDPLVFEDSGDGDLRHGPGTSDTTGVPTTVGGLNIFTPQGLLIYKETGVYFQISQ